VEAEDRDVECSFGIVGEMEREVESRFTACAIGCDETRMLPCAFLDCAQGCGHLASIEKVNDCCFGVTPRKVLEQLVNRRKVLLASVPEFALCHKQVFLFVPHQDVGLSCLVKGFAGG
jgi:hypothetical protein